MELDGSLGAMTTVEYQFDGTRYSLGSMNMEKPSERIMMVNGIQTTLNTPNYLGTARIIGGTSDGVYVLVEDVKFGEPVMVAQSVLHIRPDGVIDSASVVPYSSEDGAYIRHNVVVRPDGMPLALTVGIEAIRIWELTPSDPDVVDLGASRLSNGRNVSDRDTGVVRQGLYTYPGCLSQAYMTSNADEYLNTYLWLSSTNINNPSSCDEVGYVRWKPGYLGSAGWYPSVSYDWGGWDTPSQFASYMSSAGKAGNTNNSRGWGLACTYGVDCSGFTARVWGISGGSKPSTTQLASSTYSSVAYGPGYYTGDAFINPGVHVCVYDYTGGNGFYLWESAGSPYDRVVYRTSAWSYVSGWVARHSNNHCNY